MNSSKYAITFACYNQVEYTRQCIDSMIQQGNDLSRLVVIDNGSTDDTRNYLQSIPLGGLIFNQSNLGCGVAWNQGALTLQAEWTIIMNNDVLVSPEWIENLIYTAEKNNLKIISPALIEGSLDYDFNTFSSDASKKMKGCLRTGDRHAVCLAVHQSVWMDIGYFQPTPKLLGYEDTLFFHEADKAGIATGMTGASWLHHYGSVTQSAMKQERGLKEKDGLAYRYNYRLLKQSWLERKLKKIRKKNQQKEWSEYELEIYDMTLHGLRINNEFSWQ
ncbi:MAG: glycosyltransferase [Methylococcales bacterium]|nr:glycosyltransferase [Methylococcales bacterium]